MATRDDREGAKFTRDQLDQTACGLGHQLTWILGPNANRAGHAYVFVGTCDHCGGNAHAGSMWSSCTSVVDVRHHPCGGPGTHVLTEIEQARMSELLAPAIDEFRGAVRRIVSDMN